MNKGHPSEVYILHMRSRMNYAGLMTFKKIKISEISALHV